MTTARIVVLVPCYNEGTAIAKVVQDFRAHMPAAAIYVYDNNSTDDTFARAVEAGAIVRTEPRQGKGNVVRRMFADIEADIYILVDGDDTYDASIAPALARKLADENLDIVSGKRIATGEAAYRPGHVMGNLMLTGLTSMIFGIKLSDMLTGYRVMSRRFVKSFPFSAEGFGIETELSVHAARLMMPSAEVETRYKERAEGTVSKLNTYRDGFRILYTIATLMREERPFTFFSVIAVLFGIASLALGAPV
ncbi:MAG TPA: glycosyltransferase family 2 protein, partial [Rhizomicrobium sp.]